MLRRLLVALLCAHAAAGSWSSWWSGEKEDPAAARDLVCLRPPLARGAEIGAGAGICACASSYPSLWAWCAAMASGRAVRLSLGPKRCTAAAKAIAKLELCCASVLHTASSDFWPKIEP